jgi:hypothetical protein
MIPQQITARKKKYIGNTYLPTDRSTTTLNSPPPLPSPGDCVVIREGEEF